ncbi:hypothetical protein [Haliangium sp.]|uniref:hypothetical protein n=1 Tax=Haliangium sp. TaxID=2663208 RepID=UPI003D0DD08A
MAALAAALVATGCGAPDDDPILPPPPPRAELAHCLAGLDLAAAGPDDPIAWPETLSATGCFTDLATAAPAPDLAPFYVISPLWTDGADKRRYLALPPGATASVTAEGAWELPAGAILVKLFSLERRRGDPDSLRPVEVRFLVRTSEGWEFAGYVWTPDGDEATLNRDHLTLDIAIEPADDDGEPEVLAYGVPGPDACGLCHADVTGVALGPRSAQLNRVVRYPDGRRNQIEALAAAGYLGDVPADLSAIPTLVDPADESAPVADRARSYLDVNCAHCHQPGGWTDSELHVDFRYATPLADAFVCGQPIQHTIARRDGAYVLAPGDLADSNMYQRLTGTTLTQMPPLGRSIPDPLGEEVVRRWIESLDGCPE